MIRMKKLNNNGWGLTEMLIFSAILLLVLLLVVYLIGVFYSNFS